MNFLATVSFSPHGSFLFPCNEQATAFYQEREGKLGSWKPPSHQIGDLWVSWLLHPLLPCLLSFLFEFKKYSQKEMKCGAQCFNLNQSRSHQRTAEVVCGSKRQPPFHVFLLDLKTHLTVRGTDLQAQEDDLAFAAHTGWSIILLFSWVASNNSTILRISFLDCILSGSHNNKNIKLLGFYNWKKQNQGYW